MARANHLMELTDRINDLKTKCRVQCQSKHLGLKIHKATGILKHTYTCMYELLMYHSNLKVDKEIR